MSLAPKTMFWVALLLVFAQIAHAFDACAARLENASPLAIIVSSPCSAGHNCDLCSVVPAQDICEMVSDLATRAPSIISLAAPPFVVVDARFISSPVPQFLAQSRFVSRYPSAEVPPLRSQYLAPQLCGRAPPFSV